VPSERIEFLQVCTLPSRVNRHAGTAAGDVQDLGGNVGSVAGEHRLSRTDIASELKRVGGDVDRHHSRAVRGRDHHRRQSHSTASVYGHPVGRFGAPQLSDGTVRGSEPATETGRHIERHLVRQPDQVYLGTVDRYQLGERPPMREAWLGLSLAHLPVAAQTGRALARRRKRTAR